MAKKTNKGKAKKVALVILGLIAAILLFIQQPVTAYLQDGDQADSTSAHTGSKPDKGTASYQMMTYDVLVPAVQLNLFHSFDLLLELPALEDTSAETVENTTRVLDAFMEILFNRITTPNAP